MAWLKITVALVLLLELAAEDLTNLKTHEDPLKQSCNSLESSPIALYAIESCFVPMSISKTYQDAANSCGTLPCGHLAYLANKAQAELFGELMKRWGYDNCTTVWTALYKYQGQVWKYELYEGQMHIGKKIPWYPGQPKNDQKLTHGSFMISAKTGEWEYGYLNEPADKKNYYVCQYVKPGRNGCPR